MKFASLAALLIVAGAASPVLADGHTVASAEVAAALTINTPIETLMADDRAKAVVISHLPGLNEHPAYSQFKTMSLLELKPWSQGLITDEVLEKIETDLAAIG